MAQRGRPRGRGRANPVDEHVGVRLRARRTLMGLSQESLAESLGITFQQVQKYERGANRVSASRLFDLSSVLEVPIAYFFDELTRPRGLAEGRARFEAKSGAKRETPKRETPGAKRETLDLVRTYARIADPKARKRVLDLAKSLAPGDDDAP